MNELQKVFKYGESPVRTVVKGEEVWFVLTDVCKVLELSTPSRVKDRLDDGVSTTHTMSDTLGRPQQMTIINEDGLYDVILESRKPEAKSFRKWVTSQVLPSIRKTGSYSVSLPQTFAEALRLAADLEEEKQKLLTKTLMLEQQVAEAEPKVTYYDEILKSTNVVTITQIAKDYGMSGQGLNDLLHEEGVQYKQSGQWLLYHKHQDKGYTKSETQTYRKSNGETGTKLHTKWTQKGRLFIHSVLASKGIEPLMDREEIMQA